MKKLLAITAVSLPFALASGAWAQTSASPAASPSTPAAGNGAGASSAASSTTAPSSSAGTSNTTGTPGAPATSTDSTTGSGTMSSSNTAGSGGMNAGSSNTANTDTANANDPGTQAVSGWSVKDKIGKSVYNENDDKVGDIKDVVMATEGKAAYFIVGAGGFLGMGEHEVAIPYEEITGTDKLMLQGYTKDQLKALPRVEVPKQ